jgi:tetratricopeptide (TPR) repeat protein
VKARGSFVIAAAAFLAIASAACGGSGRTRASGPRRVTPKLPPVKADALAQFDAGMRALKLGGAEATEKAKPRFSRAVAIDPNLWEAWYNLGAVLFVEGDDEGAAEAFTSALKVNAAYIPAVLARAEAYRRAGERKKARADYITVIQEQPQEVQGYARQASLLREMGAYEDALDVCREALRRAGGSSAIYVELGLVYLGQGRADLAELVLGKAAELDKNNAKKDPAIYNAAALVALERGQNQVAFERFDAATSIDPSFHDARFNTASVLLDVGDYEGARTHLQRVLDANPDDLEAHVAFGVAQRGLKQYDQARVTWERVVKTAPTRSRVRADALWNLVVLEMDFVMNEGNARSAIARYLDAAPGKHEKRKEALERQKELGGK